MCSTLAASRPARIREKYGREDAAAADVAASPGRDWSRTPVKEVSSWRPPRRRLRPEHGPQKGTLDYLELALENLNKAREHAQKDARGQIDSTVERIRETIKDVAAEIRRRAYQGD